MMKRFIIIVLLPIFLVACAKAPLRIVNERHYYDSFWRGFSSTVVSYSFPVAHGDHIYFGTNHGHLIAAKAKNGRKDWKVKLRGSIDVPPAVDGKNIYVGTSIGHVYALRADNGKEIWKTEISGGVLGQPVILDRKKLVLGADDGMVYALAIESGNLLWRYRSNLPDRITIRGFATPILDQSRLYAAFSDGSVVSLKAKDGTEVWRSSFPSETRFPDIVAPLTLVDDYLVASQFSGGLHTLRTDGTSGWSYSRGGSGVSPLKRGNQLYVAGAQGHLAALEFKTGNKKWAVNVEKPVNWSGLVFFDKHLLAASFEGTIYIVDPQSGAVEWKYEFGSPVVGPPLVVPNKR